MHSQPRLAAAERSNHAFTAHAVIPQYPSPWHIKTYYDILMNARQFNNNALRSVAASDLRTKMNKGGKDFYKFIKRDYRGGCSAVHDPVTNRPTTYLPRIHELFYDTWVGIFQMHKLKKPNWNVFEKNYEAYFPNKQNALNEPPTDVQLFQQAQRAAPDTNAGMDGWKPYELKLLPLSAWTKRRVLLCVCRKST